MKQLTWPTWISIVLLLSACAGSTKQSTPTPTSGLSSDQYPEWVASLVATFEKDPVGNPPQSIWQYLYKGQIVYYVPAQCCDQFSRLYDASGKVICAPDGGFTGEGDGKCSDFFQERKDGKLTWKDSRPR